MALIYGVLALKCLLIQDTYFPPAESIYTEGNNRRGEKTMVALLRLRDLMEIMKISRSTLWRVQQRNDFPKPVEVMGCKRWRHEELKTWLDTRAALRDDL